MKVITGYLEKFGSNFLVASLIPSLGMVIACLWVFDPIFHFASAFRSQSGVLSLFDISIWIIVLTVIIGYTLTALNTFILKVFEGYVILNRLPLIRSGYFRKAKKLIARRELIKGNIELLEQKTHRSSEEDISLDVLKTEYYALVGEYDQNFPPLHAGIMPTKFGNILKASEAYSGTRYGIDGVQFWPRLWHVIPDSYKQTILDTRNELSFLVNMSALSIVFYLLCALAIFTNAPSPVSPDWNGFLSTSFRYIVAGLLALLSNWFFNRAALLSVGDFGMMIRSSYDLFRLDLLEQFRQKPPKNSVEEFKMWKNLGELIILGQESLDFHPLNYEIKKQKK